MPTVLQQMGANATYPGSNDAVNDAHLARDGDDATRSRQNHSATIGNRNGQILTLPADLPEDLETLDAVRVRFRWRHDGPPIVPGLIENYHAAYVSKDAGATWSLLIGGENGLPTDRDEEITQYVDISPPPTVEEWPNTQVLIQNWLDFAGAGVPSNP